MQQFLVSVLLFAIGLALFGAVLHWVGYKKGDSACTCGRRSCSSEGSRLEKDEIPHDHEKEDCGSNKCTCDD